jgi:hypothetical protein
VPQNIEWYKILCFRPGLYSPATHNILPQWNAGSEVIKELFSNNHSLLLRNSGQCFSYFSLGFHSLEF